MRAVNLIPKDYRKGPLAGRGGEIASYAIIGGLAAVLLAVVAVVISNNQISDRTAEVAKLQQQQQQAKARADALQSFASFRTMEEQRVATVTSLAKSRFDWERVLRELAVVLPGDVWLTNVTGTVVPEVQLDNSVTFTSRSSVPGPALQVEGCAKSQDAVAGFVAALQNIDGVTRVGVQTSNKPDLSAAGASSAGGGSGGASGATADCRTRPSIPQFQIVVAFDAAPTPLGTTGSTGTTTTPATPTTPTTPSPNPQQQAQQQQAAQQQSVQQATNKAHGAVNNYTPGH